MTRIRLQHVSPYIRTQTIPDPFSTEAHRALERQYGAMARRLREARVARIRATIEAAQEAIAASILQRELADFGRELDADITTLKASDSIGEMLGNALEEARDDLMEYERVGLLGRVLRWWGV